MGGTETKSANQYASIFIDLPSNQYAPGEYVRGQAEILVREALNVNDLDLFLIGYEQTQWWVHTDKVHIRYGGKREIIDQRIPLVSFYGNALGVGFHKIDFGFEIPTDLPGAFMWYHGDWFARVEYKLKVCLRAVESVNNLGFDRFLLIQQKSISAKEENRELKDERKVKSFCCIPKGMSKLRAKFENNELKVNQIARAFLHIDNSECKADIPKIKIALRRKIWMISDRGHRTHYYKTVAWEMFPGIGKKERTPEVEPRLLELNLKKFITDFLARCKQYNKKLQQRYGNYFLQPSTKTKLIRCDYYVQIKPEYDVTCMCCSGAPKIVLPIALAIPEEQKIQIVYEEEDAFKGPYEGQQYAHEMINMKHKEEEQQLIEQ